MNRRRAIAAIAAAAVVVAQPRSAVGTVPSGVPVSPTLSVMPRSAWAGDSRPPTGPLYPEDVRFLLVHHTASFNGAEPIALMRSVYDFHTGPDKGWPDVAYNFFIDHFGTVWEARLGSLAGPVEASATGGSQGFAQLVCLLGDFTSVLPTDAALRSLNATLAWLADRYAIDTSADATVTFQSRGSNRWSAGTSVTTRTIAGHRDMSATACPGDTFYPYLADRVQTEVHQLRRIGSPQPTAPSTTPDAVASTTNAVPATLASTTAPLAATTSTSTSTSTTTSAPTTTRSESLDLDSSAGLLPAPAPSPSIGTAVDGGEPGASAAGDGGGGGLDLGEGLVAAGAVGAVVAAGWYAWGRVRDSDRQSGAPPTVPDAGDR